MSEAQHHEKAVVQHPHHNPPPAPIVDPIAQREEEKKKATEAANSAWGSKVKGVIDSYHIPVASAGLGPVTPVVGAVERSIWGSQIEDANLPPPPEAMKARQDYNKKVADLQEEINKLRLEKGADDPEYQEAQRIFNVTFR